MTILNKLKTLMSYRNVYENWISIILARYGFLGKGFIVSKLKNGLEIKSRKMSMDYAAMSEVFVRKDYNKFFEVKENDTVIDVGAHIGSFSALAGSKGANVYSFEPEKNNFKLLKENVKTNLLTEKIKCFNLAVDMKRGTDFLYMSKNLGAHSFFNEWAKTSEKQKIKKITIKDVFAMNKLNKCDFLKMDCEGAEYNILFNTPKSVLEKMEKIAMEYHVVEEKSGEAMKEFLEKNGFKVIMTEPSDIGTGMIYAVKND